MKKINSTPAVVLLVTLALTLSLISLSVSDATARLWGFVATKGRVLDDNGNPIWAEHDEDGNVVGDIDVEDATLLKTARVMSAADYRHHLQAFQDINDQYGAQSDILTKEEYQSRAFTRPDGVTISKPALGEDTAWVVVRNQDLIYNDAISLILFESPIALKPLTPIQDDIQSVLLSRKGEVIHISAHNIGHRVAFYTEDGATEHYDGESKVVGNMGYRAGEGYQWGQRDMFGFDAGKDQLWGPMQDVEVTYCGGNRTLTSSTGQFDGADCYYFHTGYAKLRYKPYDPQSQDRGVYWVKHGIGTSGSSVKFEVDVVMVGGMATMGNPGTGGVASGDATTYAYTAPSYTPPTPDPDALRLPDAPPDFSNQGLLQTVTEEDLKNTDIYIFRSSNGMLITSREGLADHEYIPHFETGLQEDTITFNMMIRAGNTFVTKDDLDRGYGWNYDSYQEATNAHEKLQARKADHLRPGEEIQVVVINRATGYIGTGTSIVGETSFKNVHGAEVRTNSIELNMGAIRMGPPNLKIKAERKFSAEAGLTKDTIYENIIGFEGSGLTSDTYVSISTEWYNHDGSLLPADLPGYTGRLARVSNVNTLSAVAGSDQNGNQLANFDIKPGKHLQLVRLPQAQIDNDHYYLHVSGERYDGGNADFSTIGAAQAGPLQYRPSRYVPVRVPIFDEAATLEVARAQTAALRDEWQPGDPLPILENIEKIYRWPYRPEMQFSVFDFEIDPLELVTDIDEDTGKSTSDLTFRYDLESDLAYDPLDPLGTGRTLVFGLGYAEILALLGEDRQAQFPSLEQLLAMTPLAQYQAVSDLIGNLEPEDFLGLQLYQNEDAGNQLAEIYGMPLVGTAARPIKLMRQHYLSQFDSTVPGNIGAGYTDGYTQIRLEMFAQADVTVNLLNKDEEQRGELIGETRLSPGPSVFLVDYASVAAAGISASESSDFILEVKAKAVDGSYTHRVLFPGELLERTEGKMLGQIMVHDVMIQDGSLNLSRSDLTLPGRGPALAFSRSYSNQTSRRGPQPLGHGWRHNYQQALNAWTSEAFTDQPVPDWVANLKGTFFRPSQIPEPSDEWNAVSVNGTTFKRVNSSWYAERGRHGSLIQSGDEFVYTAKDGTRYYYDVPRRMEAVRQTQADYTSIHVGDSLVTRIGLDPNNLLLPNDQPPKERKTSNMPGPSPIKRIVDRTGNAMQFTYTFGRLDTVTDAVGRELNFQYQVFGPLQERLTKVTGPDNIEINFAYNDKQLLQSITRDSLTETYAYDKEIQATTSAYRYNLVSATDVNTHTTTYAYFAPNELNGALNGVVTAIKDYDVVKRVEYPDTHDAHFAYDATTDNLRTVTDLRGNATVYYLNYYGNPIRIVEPADDNGDIKESLMTWSIDEGGNDNVMLSKTDGRQLPTTYTYDAKGNIETETDPYLNTITTTWNQAYSLPLTRMDRNGVEQSWAYDTNGDLLTHTDGDDKITRYTYWDTGERKTATDPRQNVTSYSYDEFGNPDTVTAYNSITNYDYDLRGRKETETDPNGNLTRYTYNTLDQLIQVTYPTMAKYSLPQGFSNIETFTYDPKGNLLTKTDRLGLTLTHTYTDRDQVETITRSADNRSKNYDYDENGNLIAESDWKGTDKVTTHAYDARNQRTSTTNRLLHPMTMAYDLNGNLETQTDFEGRTTTYVFDDLNRITEIHQPDLDGQAVVTYRTYYDEGDSKTNLKTETDPEGNETTYTYNGRYQPNTRLNAARDTFTWTYDDAGNLESETDEAGNTLTHTYDNRNRRTDTHGTLDGRSVRIAHNTYDDAGNLIAVMDAEDHTIQTEYDEWHRACVTIDAEDNRTTIHLDGAGNKVYERDGNGHERNWTYNTLGLLTAYVDAEEAETTYSYDANNNPEYITYDNGAVTFTTYDDEDRERAVTEAQGFAETRTRAIVSRDKNGNVLEERDFNNNPTIYAYNDLNLVETITDAAGEIARKTYWRTGKLKTETDRRGHDTDYEYDELNRVRLVTDELEQTIVTTYDAVGNVKTITDKRKIVSENFYDDFYRLVRVEKDSTRLLTNAYDDVGNLTAVIDAEDNRTAHTYWDNNWKKVTTFADTTTNSFTYDGVGNLTIATDELLKDTTYTYDDENRQKTITFADETTAFVYDKMGNKTFEIKPKLNKRQFQYDHLNRLVSVIDDPDGQALTTEFVYDANGNLRHQYDVRDNHVEYTYNNLNRKTAHIQHKSGGNLTVSYDLYDEAGNLKQMTDAMGRIFTYDYDVLNRQTHRHIQDIDSPYHQTTTVATGYDENNNVTAITETKVREDNTTFTDVTVNTYDNFDRLDDTTQRGLLTDYGYDLNGNRTSVSTPAGATTYSYDIRNRLETAVADLQTTTYTYYDDGRQESVTHPNGTRADYTYTAANRIDTITHSRTADSSVISSYDYAYDSNGNRTQQIEVQDGAAETTTYAFDVMDRLREYTITGADTLVTAYTYEGYNRKTETVTENGTVTKQRTYHYDPTDWLTRIDDTTDTGSPYTIAYTYDNNGNTLNKSNSSLTNADEIFAYDALNRLVETKRGPPAAETVTGRYDYNAAGLRIRHRLSERGDVDYFYDSNAVIEEHDATDDSLLAHYRYADRLLSLDTGAGKQYYHHDALGSTVNLTTAAAAVQVSYKLDPWGHVRDQVGTSVNRQIFTGQEHDGNTGLIYFGARYFDPDTARFITQDSYLGESGTPPSLHRYLYSYSNPTVYVDPTGHEPITLTAAAIYTGWAGLNSLVDTGIDWGFHKLLGEGKFNTKKALATNFSINMVSAGVGGKVSKLKHLGTLGKKAINYGVKLTGEVYRARQDGLSWDEAIVSGVGGTVLGDATGKAAAKSLRYGKTLVSGKAKKAQEAVSRKVGQAKTAVKEGVVKLTSEVKDSLRETGERLLDRFSFRKKVVSDGTPELRKTKWGPGKTVKVGPHTVGKYKDVKGHHPRQQAARSDNPNYNPDEALAIKDDGTFNHKEISRQQQILNAKARREARETGSPYAEDAIQKETMKAGDIEEGHIDEILRLEAEVLEDMGAREPTRIPGTRRKK